jgi:murein DD-endopeptidase MepM/ murein hydrolase activator NlpD
MAQRTETDWRHGTARALGVAVLLASCAGGACHAGATELPQATYYTVIVRPGDTVSTIAMRYDASAAEVEGLNRLKNGNRLYSGEVLRVPALSRQAREAVLAEAASASLRNYAAPPKPIDVKKFARVASVLRITRVSVRNLPPPVARAEDANTDWQAELKDVLGAPATDARSHFIWPVEGRIISPFGNAGNGERNDGINIAAATGTPIHAAAAGTVRYAGNELKAYGNLVLIQHEDGYVTAYAHAESLSVSAGDHVDKGQVIGLAGATGEVNRPQLHFEIRKGVKPVNPKPLLVRAIS